MNLARPREIEESRSKKVVVHQHFYESVSTHANAHICLHKAKELMW